MCRLLLDQPARQCWTKPKELTAPLILDSSEGEKPRNFTATVCSVTHRRQPQTVRSVKTASPMSSEFVRRQNSGARDADPLKVKNGGAKEYIELQRKESGSSRCRRLELF